MTKKKSKLQLEPANPESAEPKLETAPETEATVEAEVEAAGIEDPIGDTTDGEARTSVEADAAAEPEIEAEGGPEPEDDSDPEDNPESDDASEPESDPKPRPPAKLERLQKILAAAGVASRRSAEAMIEQGRVQVNGKVVTVLGTKADAGRDHIRVDGKLLQGAERHRYFVLNKPKGFVTTVKDPEGRPTVMQFFDKMKERLYPVGRLDYMSEGLLVVTNDGELANRLTKASSGVEKTYLVKVAGQPTEASWTFCAAAWLSNAASQVQARCAPHRHAFARSARATIHGTKWFSLKAATANCARCSRKSATLWRKSAASATVRWFWTRSRATCASWSRQRWRRCAGWPKASCALQSQRISAVAT
jgi:16S rRNA U516 pseudouridylate synthase RsuA-like enzyme